MFTDMVGYTALGQRNESLSLALVEEQRRLIRSILSKHNGREVKTIGDAFLVEFLSAMDAVRCAYDIQRTTREFNISEPVEHNASPQNRRSPRRCRGIRGRYLRRCSERRIEDRIAGRRWRSLSHASSLRSGPEQV